ncbi:MAG: DMT family transporter [Planctomycetota bacterium]
MPSVSAQDEHAPRAPHAAGSARAAPASTDPRARRQGYVALSVVQLCFGLFPTFGKVAFAPGAFSPFAVGAWRILFGAASLSAAALILHRRDVIPRARDMAWFALCSWLGIAINMSLYLEGLQRSTATNAGLIVCLIPVFTFAIAAAFKHEAFERARAAGLALALAGAAAIHFAESPDLARAHLTGNLMMVANALSYSFYLVLARPLLQRYPPLVVIAWMFVWSLPCLPFLLRNDVLWHDGIPGTSIAALGFVLVFATVVAYLLNIFALSRLRSSTTAVFIYVQPLIAGVSAWFVLAEKPSPHLAIAAALIFAGIWLVVRPMRAVPSAPTSAA